MPLHLATFSKLVEYNVAHSSSVPQNTSEVRRWTFSLHCSALDSRKLLDYGDDVNYYENEKGLTR